MPEVESRTIRHHFDRTTGKWYFAIADTLVALTDTLDGRNYWKVLKNRLKKTNFQLVTNCNQLKMMAKDGKYYLTDVADAQTLIDIIESVPKASVEALKLLIKDIEENNAIVIPTRNVLKMLPRAKEEETEEIDTESELFIDAYQTKTHIIIEAMVAGVLLPDIYISVFPEKVILRGKRERTESEKERKYLYQELLWTDFSRSISLPSPVKTKNIERRERRGHLQIRLEKTEEKE